MPMNPRLLRPTSSTLDRDAAIYLNAVAFADGQQLEPAVRKAINNFVIGCKRDGIWTAIKASCILMGARTLSGALVSLVGTAATNNGPFVSGDYNRKTGLLGNGTTKYLDSNRNNNADGQNNQHLAVYVSVTSTVGPSLVIGNTGVSGRSSISISGGSYASRSRSQTATTHSAVSTGLVGISRSASASYVFRQSSSNSTVNVSSLSPDDQDLGVFASSLGDFPSAPRLAYYSIGESLDLALLDTRVSALYNAIGAAI